MKKKEIIYISPNGYLGGAERFVLEACTGHIELGSFQPHVLFFNEGDALEIFKGRGIPFTVLKNKFNLKSPISLFKACLEIRELFLNRGWQIYNATMAYPQFVMGLALWGLPTKRVWYQHGPVGNIYDFLASLFPYDYALFNSSYTLGCHQRIPLFQAPLRKEIILPYGIPETQPNLEQVASIQAQYKKSESDIILLLAGRICSWKGYETGFNALRNLINENPTLKNKIQLLVVGDAKTDRDQPYKELLISLSEDPTLKGNVHFLGKKINIQDYLKAADIFLHTSTIPEPFGLVVAEAMQQGTLVVGTNQGGTPDMLQQGVTGFSFDSTSDTATLELTNLLRKIIRELRIQPQKLESISASGKNKIQNDFSVSAMTKNLEELYSQALN